MKFVIFGLVTFASLQISTCLSVIDKSADQTFVNGQTESIFCSGDASMDFCMWKFNEQDLCSLKKDKEEDCGRIDGSQCFLNFDNPSRKDVGTYTCTLFGGDINAKGESLFD